MCKTSAKKRGKQEWRMKESSRVHHVSWEKANHSWVESKREKWRTTEMEKGTKRK